MSRLCLHDMMTRAARRPVSCLVVGLATLAAGCQDAPSTAPQVTKPLAAPAVVTGFQLASVSAPGNHFACGIAAPSGQLFCWGKNEVGTLGNGTYGPDASVPEPVASGLAFSSVSTGSSACAVAKDGAAYCWGPNVFGNLGDGTISLSLIGSLVPVRVALALPFTAISVGNSSACGVTKGGAVYCWGNNTGGELGIGDDTGLESCVLGPCSSTPLEVSVPGGVDVAFTSVSVGNQFACALTKGGAAYCWGNNLAGQLGDGSTTESSVPVKVSLASPLTQIGTGSYHACGLTKAGAVYCWGAGGSGQLGTGTLSDSPVPVQVPSPRTFASVSAGGSFSCAVAKGAAAYCWGDNQSGQLGDGTTNNRALPVPVSGSFAFTSVAAGVWSTCGITKADGAYCWGDNSNGELGIGSSGGIYVAPQPVRSPAP